MSPAPTFELLGFEATPVGAAVAVVELEGRFAGPAPPAPRLLVETGGVSRELPALDARDGAAWSATFAIPLGALEDPAATFALAPSRGPLIVLPAPTQSGGEDDRFVRLARAANDLRHRLQSAMAAASAAEARLAEVEAQRDALTAELSSASESAAAAERRSEESHAAAVAAREEQARAEGEADEAHAEAERARSQAEAEIARVRAEGEAEVARAMDEARVELRAQIERAEAEAATAREQLADAQDRAIAAEDEARAARRDLRDARARIESLLRQARTTRSAAARARIPSATPDHDDAEFRAARLGPGWADGADDEDTAPLAADRSARLTDRAGVEGAAGPGGEGGDEGRDHLADHTLAGDGADRGDEEPDRLADHTLAGGTTEEGDEEPDRLADHTLASRTTEVGDEGSDARPASLGAPAGSDALTGAVVDDRADGLADRGGYEEAAAAAGSADDDTTASFEPVAGEAPTTARLAPASPRAPELWGDDEDSKSVRVLGPRTSAGRLRPARVGSPPPSDDSALDPAAVGARLLQPAETSPRHRAIGVLTSPRVIVGAIFVLLFVALVLIFEGIGFV